MIEVWMKKGHLVSDDNRNIAKTIVATSFFLQGMKHVRLTSSVGDTTIIKKHDKKNWQY